MKLAKRLIMRSGGFSFSELSAAAWYDASDAGTVTNVSGYCSQILDKSGNARHITQETAQNRPAVSGGKLLFNGSQDMSYVPPTPIFGSYVLIAQIFDVSVLTTYVRPPLTIGNATNGGAPVDRYNATLVVNAEGYDGMAGLRVINAPRILITTLKKDGGGAGIHRIIERLNGTQVASATISTTWTTTGQRFCLGRRGDTLTNLNGWMGEVVALDSEPATSVIEKIEGKLAHKWDGLLGVSTLKNALPSNHPYKTSAP